MRIAVHFLRVRLDARCQHEQIDLELMTDPQALRSAYLERLQAFISKVRGACLNNRIEYALIKSSRDSIRHHD